MNMHCLVTVHIPDLSWLHPTGAKECSFQDFAVVHTEQAWCWIAVALYCAITEERLAAYPPLCIGQYNCNWFNDVALISAELNGKLLYDG